MSDSITVSRSFLDQYSDTVYKSLDRGASDIADVIANISSIAVASDELNNNLNALISKINKDGECNIWPKVDYDDALLRLDIMVLLKDEYNEMCARILCYLEYIKEESNRFDQNGNPISFNEFYNNYDLESLGSLIKTSIEKTNSQALYFLYSYSKKSSLLDRIDEYKILSGVEWAEKSFIKESFRTSSIVLADAASVCWRNLGTATAVVAVTAMAIEGTMVVPWESDEQRAIRITIDTTKTSVTFVTSVAIASCGVPGAGILGAALCISMGALFNSIRDTLMGVDPVDTIKRKDKYGNEYSIDVPRNGIGKSNGWHDIYSEYMKEKKVEKYVLNGELYSATSYNNKVYDDLDTVLANSELGIDNLSEYKKLIDATLDCIVEEQVNAANDNNYNPYLLEVWAQWVDIEEGYNNQLINYVLENNSFNFPEGNDQVCKNMSKILKTLYKEYKFDIVPYVNMHYGYEWDDYGVYD